MIAPLSGAGPMYHRIADNLRLRVRRGDWAVGAMLPSRSDLAQEYGVALNTLQRAVQSLLEEGWLHADPKRGTYVSPSAPIAASDSSPRTSISRTSAVVGIVGFEPDDPEQRQYEERPWTASVIDGAERVIGAEGGRSLIFDVAQHSGNVRDPVPAFSAARDAGVDALIVINIVDMHSWYGNFAAWSEKNDLTSLYVGAVEKGYHCPHVRYDQEAAGYAAGRHLLASGYRRIVAPVPFAAAWLENRIAGARLACEKAGVGEDALLEVRAPDYESRMHLGALSEEERFTHYRTLLEPCVNTSEADAILAPNDAAARQIQDWLEGDLGLRVGEDIGLIGFDDSPLTRRRGLSSVAIPLEDFGETAARLVLRVLKGEPLPLQTVLRPSVMARRSTLRTG